MTVKKWVYFFGAGKAEGDGSWREEKARDWPR